MKKTAIILLSLIFVLVAFNSVYAESIFKKKKNPMAGYGEKRTVITADEWKAERDAKNKKPDSKTKTKDVKVRGLYLGMFLDDAVKLYEQKLNKPGDSYKVRKVENRWEYGYTDRVIFIRTDSNKIVDAIILNQTAHFNAGGIPTKDFTRLFSKNYKISFKYAPLYYNGYTFDYYIYENASCIIKIGQGNIQLVRKVTKKVSFD